MNWDTCLRAEDDTFIDQCFVLPYCQQCNKPVQRIYAHTATSYGWVRVIEDETERDTTVGLINLCATESTNTRGIDGSDATDSKRIATLASSGKYKCSNCNTVINNYVMYYPCVVTGTIANTIIDIGDLRVPINSGTYTYITPPDDNVSGDVKSIKTYTVADAVEQSYELLMYLLEPIKSVLPDVSISTVKDIDIAAMYRGQVLRTPAMSILAPPYTQPNAYKLYRRYYAVRTFLSVTEGVTLYANTKNGFTSKRSTPEDTNTDLILDYLHNLQDQLIAEYDQIDLGNATNYRQYHEKYIVTAVNGLLLAHSPIQSKLNELKLRKLTKIKIIKDFNTHRYNLLLAAIRFMMRSSTVNLKYWRDTLENMLGRQEIAIVVAHHNTSEATMQLFNLQHKARTAIKYNLEAYFNE